MVLHSNRLDQSRFQNLTNQQKWFWLVWIIWEEDVEEAEATAVKKAQAEADQTKKKEDKEAKAATAKKAEAKADQKKK